MKLINDTLKHKGKWSRKSLTACLAFVGALAYEFVLPFYKIETKDYVFLGLVSLAAGVLGLTVIDKKKKDENI